MGCPIKCILCGNIIESTSTHDFVRCSCGTVFIDGGDDYLHLGAKDKDAVRIFIDHKWVPLSSV